MGANSFRANRIALVMAMSGVAVLVPSTAGATLPGGNGRIAFASERDGNFEIYMMNPDGTGLVRLTNHPSNDFNPSWSPDGTKIAFASDRGDGDYDVYVMNSDGGGLTQLTDDPADDATPDWSPDGTEIVFESARGSALDNEDVYKMDADGSNETQLTDDPEADGSPAFSPDGTVSRTRFALENGPK